MKSNVLIITLLAVVLGCPGATATEEIALAADDYEHLDSAEDIINPSQIYEEPIILDKEDIRHIKITPDEEVAAENTSFIENMSNIAKNVYKLQIEDKENPSSLLEDYLTWHYEKGPIEKLHLWSVYQTNADFDFPQHGHTTTKFRQGMINIFLDGEFKGGKEEFLIQPH